MTEHISSGPSDLEIQKQLFAQQRQQDLERLESIIQKNKAKIYESSEKELESIFDASTKMAEHIKKEAIPRLETLKSKFIVFGQTLKSKPSWMIGAGVRYF